MQAIPRWRNLLNSKGANIRSTTIALMKSRYFLADFHSTSSVNEKWKPKGNSDYIRYKVHQKRADTNKALKNLLFNDVSIHHNFQVGRDTVWDLDQEDHLDKKVNSKSSGASRRAAKAQHRRMKRKHKREKFDESDDMESIFRASFGKKWCTWAANDFSYESPNGFDWNEKQKGNYRKQQESDIESDDEYDKDSCVNNMFLERKALGLPSNGVLKIEEIKTAFRLSALKWHPDKHQGSLQAIAEEKFKYCVDAYKSLCSSLSQE